MNERQNLRVSEIAENKEEIQLILLDENLNDKSCDYIAMTTALIELNSTAQFYSDFDRCLDFITSIRYEHIFLVISDSVVEKVLSHVENHRLLAAIFILVANPQQHPCSTIDHEKIIGVYTDQRHLLEAICDQMKSFKKQIVFFNIIDQKQKSLKDLTKESASFCWYQMLVFILKEIPQDPKAKQQMIDFCQHYYQNNKQQLKQIAKFDKKYSSDNAIEWYTDESFLYILLNKALRTEDINLLFTFRFYLLDLCAHIKNESEHIKDKGILTLYRGAKIPNNELENARKNIGQTISLNGFLSTSKNKSVALAFASSDSVIKGFESILFEIQVDPSLQTVFCADVANKSRMKDEQEVLFSLGSIFQIQSIYYDKQVQLWIIKLITTNDGYENVEKHLKFCTHQLKECPAMIHLGCILMRELGKTDQAEEYFKTLLKSLPRNHENLASVNSNLGNVYRSKGELNRALEYYRIGYEIRLEGLPQTRPHLAGSHHNIGTIENEKGNHDLALSHYQKALRIKKKSRGDSEHKATIIKNIGIVYGNKNDLNKALRYLFGALKQFKRILPDQHSQTASCFGDIGDIWGKKNNFKVALGYYQQQLAMQEKYLPFDHLDLSSTLDSIVDAYKKMNEIDKGLELCREKLVEQKNRLGENHRCMARTLISMGNTVKDNNSNEAVQYYTEALSILENYVPLDHLTAATCFNAMACTYSGLGSFEDALQNHLKALDLQRQKLYSNHIYIASSLNMIGSCYRDMKNSSEARRYYKESLSIYRATYGPEHENVKEVETNIVKLNIS